MTHFTAAAQKIARTAAALSLALGMTLVSLASLNHLATEQHAATVLAKAAATQQNQAANAAAAHRG